MNSLFIGLLVGIVFFLFPIVIGIVLFFILIVRIRWMFRKGDDDIQSYPTRPYKTHL